MYNKGQKMLIYERKYIFKNMLIETASINGNCGRQNRAKVVFTEIHDRQ